MDNFSIKFYLILKWIPNPEDLDSEDFKNVPSPYEASKANQIAEQYFNFFIERDSEDWKDYKDPQRSPINHISALEKRIFKLVKFLRENQKVDALLSDQPFIRTFATLLFAHDDKIKKQQDRNKQIEKAKKIKAENRKLKKQFRLKQIEEKAKINKEEEQ